MIFNGQIYKVNGHHCLFAERVLEVREGKEDEVHENQMLNAEDLVNSQNTILIIRDFTEEKEQKGEKFNLITSTYKEHL